MFEIVIKYNQSTGYGSMLLLDVLVRNCGRIFAKVFKNHSIRSKTLNEMAIRKLGKFKKKAYR